MPATSVAVLKDTAPTTNLKPAQLPRSAPGKVTGRLKQALDLMVWNNLSDNEAAAKSKITVTAIRLALRRPHVRAYFREQSDVLREREGPRGIHTLIAVRDQDSNQAARVAAVREMRQANDEQAANGSRSVAVPGLVIVINGAAQVASIAANPGSDILDVASDRVSEKPSQT